MKLVFAHFYSRLPQHLVLNLKRTILLFPKYEVCLITDQECNKTRLPNLKIINYVPSQNWQKIEKMLNHPADFRNNFWFTSLARFIAIAEILKESPQAILHIESDVLLAPDFPFEIILNLKKDFAFSIVSEDLAIASCLYIKNGKSAEELAQFTMDSVKSYPATTDMRILRDFFDKYPDRVQILPTAPFQPEAFNNASEEFLSQTKSGIMRFNGIFDGFDIGRYLFGDDPRNDRGFSVLRKDRSENYLNTSKIDLFLSKERAFPFVRISKEPYILPIYSLHIHSKKLRLFKEIHTNKLVNKAVLSSKDKSQKVFSATIFFKSIFLAVRRRTRKIRLV